MGPNTKRYNDFLETYKKAYPDLKKARSLEKAQQLWIGVKNNLTQALPDYRKENAS